MLDVARLLMRRERMSGMAVQMDEKYAAGDVLDVDRNPIPPIVTGSCARAVVDGDNTSGSAVFSANVCST